MSKASFKQFRKSIGLTQAELAKYFGVSQMSVWRWETGRQKLTGPSLKLFERLKEEFEAEDAE